MVKSRVLEERLIKMFKQSDGYFWIGGPGEEAFAIPLGLNVKKGEGLNHDFLHLHYRASGIMVAMGMEPIDEIRQMKNVAGDPFSAGRNFGNHYSRKAWNVVPVSSTIETQYATAIGTGIAQARKGCTGITIVTGGDAGTAEGEFASCMLWANMPQRNLPILMIVTNNEWGISTDTAIIQRKGLIADRARAFGMRVEVVNGNDVEESYRTIKDVMEYIRKERKPAFIEAHLSRLYGHSSASGANFKPNEEDCLITFESKLEDAGILNRSKMDEIRENYTVEMREILKKVKQEPMPDPSSIYDYVYANQKGKYW